MTQRVSAKLYSPALLGLATSLAHYPLTDDLPLRAEARSRSCGSVMTLGMLLDHQGLITRVGVKVSACAIGQASAALLAQAAGGTTPVAVRLTAESISAWLAGNGTLPQWPGIEMLAPALDHPGRHGALLLPWNAAVAALSSEPDAR